VQSADYLREQAHFYLEMARVLSDPTAAEAARLTASKYFAMAKRLETGEGEPAHPRKRDRH
jgi:hypothetical protein